MTRVLPRDLFNESKLLKCMGQVALILHDKVGVRWPLALRHDAGKFDGFLIEQDPSSGQLYTANLSLYVGEIEIIVGTTYNSKDQYPLCFSFDGEELGRVFTEDGMFSPGFQAWLDTRIPGTTRHLDTYYVHQCKLCGKCIETQSVLAPANTPCEFSIGGSRGQVHQYYSARKLKPGQRLITQE